MYENALYVHTNDFVVNGKLNNSGEMVDIKGNLQISHINGTLTVNKINLTVTSASDYKVYDGTALENPNYTVTGKLASGHYILVEVTGSVILGTGKNKITKCFIFDENGKDVTKNYNVTPHEGTLEVIL